MTFLANAINNSGLNKFKSDEVLQQKLSLRQLILRNKAPNENAVSKNTGHKTTVNDSREQREGMIKFIQVTRTIRS